MTEEHDEPPAKRGRAVRRIRMQERDMAMLESLAVGRFLSVPALEWLHYPAWRTRYRRFLEERETNPEAAVYPASNIYHRLLALRTDPGALVYRITRAVERSSVVFRRLPDVYALSEAGAEVLCAARGVEHGTYWYEDPRKRSLRNLEHSVAIGTLYAALRAALEHAGQQLVDWQGDHLLAGRERVRGGANFDRVRVSGKGDYPVLPDATFTIAGQRYFVEVDMGTSSMRAWSEKIMAYEAYRGSLQLRARYQTDEYVVLVVAPSETRIRRIAEEVLKITRQPGATYRYATAERVHPTTVRSAWRAIDRYDLERRMVVDRLVELPTNIVYGSHPLWRAAREG